MRVRSVASKVGDAIRVAGKSAGSTCNRRVRLERGLQHELQRRRVAAPFPAAICEHEAPMLQLSYDRSSQVKVVYAVLLA